MRKSMKTLSRQDILQRLRDKVACGEPIIGAGAGTGISAKCEAAAGIDLIVIYNSGRFRMAGHGSLAGMMPYGDANAIVLDMAREVLPVEIGRASCRERAEGRRGGGSCGT